MGPRQSWAREERKRKGDTGDTGRHYEGQGSAMQWAMDIRPKDEAMLPQSFATPSHPLKLPGTPLATPSPWMPMLGVVCGRGAWGSLEPYTGSPPHARGASPPLRHKKQYFWANMHTPRVGLSTILPGAQWRSWAPPIHCCVAGSISSRSEAEAAFGKCWQTCIPYTNAAPWPCKTSTDPWLQGQPPCITAVW